MSVKKNLTIAILAALLAVPALGAKNVHAANLSLEQDTAPWEAKTGTGNWEVSPKNGFHKNPNGGPALVNSYTEIFHKGGHTYTVAAGNDTKGTIIGLDGNNNVSNAQVMAALEGKLGSTSDTAKTQNSSNNYSKSEYQSSNTNNGKLVQTGENNNTKTEMMAGATALAASIGLAALSLSKKRKNMTVEDVAINNADTSDNNNSHKYSNKSIYHMIMSNTFKSISNNLNKF